MRLIHELNYNRKMRSEQIRNCDIMEECKVQNTTQLKEKARMEHESGKKVMFKIKETPFFHWKDNLREIG